MKKWFSGIRVKLLVLSIIAMVSLLVVGSAGFSTVSNLSEKLKIAYNERQKLVEHLGGIESGIHASVRWLWVSVANDNNPKERKIFLQKTKDSIVALDESIKSYLAVPRVKAAQELFEKEFAPNWDHSKKIFTEITEQLEKNNAEGDAKAKTIIMSELRQSLAPVTATIDKLQTTTKNTNKVIVEEAMAYVEKAKILTISVVLISAFVCFTLSIFVASRLVKILSELSKEIDSSSVEVSSASEQIAASSEELSQATTEQAASLQETSSSIEEISSMINANTENAKKSTDVSHESLSTAERGKTVVTHMLRAIEDINRSNTGIVEQINETNKEIENIVSIINEIGNKTKVINEIVFQTKLLSFNASVEAARAGEQGKGFSVVAEEVGNLASMSGSAALEITNMLVDSTRTVESIVKDSKEKIGKLILVGKEKVEVGTKVAQECEEVLNEIVNSVSDSSKMISEISHASQEQAQGVQEITKAVAQLDQVTQQNTANAAESANAANSLSQQAELLNSLVQKLVQTIDGENVSFYKVEKKTRKKALKNERADMNISYT